MRKTGSSGHPAFQTSPIVLILCPTPSTLPPSSLPHHHPRLWLGVSNKRCAVSSCNKVNLLHHPQHSVKHIYTRLQTMASSGKTRQILNSGSFPSPGPCTCQVHIKAKRTCHHLPLQTLGTSFCFTESLNEATLSSACHPAIRCCYTSHYVL